MSAIDQNPTGGFEQRLLTALEAHVASRSTPDLRVASPVHGRGGFWRPRAGALTAAAAIAAAMVVVMLSARPGVQPALARAFPILAQSPRQLPAYMRQILETQELASFGYSTRHERAYAFRTPAGTGYVVVDERNQWLCLLIPGLGASEASVRCETSGQLLSRNALGLRLSADNGHQHELVWLLPHGSTATTITADGALRQVILRNGVLAIVTQRPVTIGTTVHGRHTTFTYPSK